MSGKAELFEVIRRNFRREELSIRALTVRHGVHRRTVRAASAVPAPQPRTAQAPKLDPLKPFINAMLAADLDAPRKQKHTARRVLARLVDEHGAVDLSYSAVRDYVSRRRPEVAAEAGRRPEMAFVPQTHLPGGEAEVDFGDVWVELAGELTKCFLFTLRLSYSGKAVHRVFASQGQEAFIEGHLAAFTVLGGVPTDKIRYDNLRSAVSRVLLGRSRTESDQWVTFRSHFGFDAFYCLPGTEGAHEKRRAAGGRPAPPTPSRSKPARPTCGPRADPGPRTTSSRSPEVTARRGRWCPDPTSGIICVCSQIARVVGSSRPPSMSSWRSRRSGCSPM